MVYGLLKRYLGLLFLSACIIPNLFAGVTQKKEKPVMFQVRKDIKYQVIDNFGASDAGGSLLSVGIGRWKNAKGLLTYFLVRRWIPTEIRLV